MDNQFDQFNKPRPLTAKIKPEDYPLDALPDIIREAVEEVRSFIKAPLPLVAGSALGAVSLACQPHFNIERAKHLSGPTSLFMLVIAESGERKTTCDGYFTSAIRKYEYEQAALAEPLLKDYEADLATWNANREGLLSAIKELGKKGNDARKQKDELKELEHHKPKPPQIPRLILGDETQENLTYTLATKWPSAGIIASEAGIVFGAHGMSNESMMRSFATYNVLWDGGTLKVGRRTSDSFTLKDTRLTMVLQTQETTLRAFLAKTGGLARGTGFLARYLVTWPESTQGSRPFSDAPDTWPNLTHFNDRITEILNTPIPLNEQGGLEPTLLSFTPEAKDYWIEFHDEIESMLKPGGELSEVRDVASKIADNAARLAALFHQITQNSCNAVDVDCMERASRIAAWYLSESKRFCSEFTMPVELANAEKLDLWLIRYCKEHAVQYVGKNYTLQYGPLRESNKLDTAINILHELDRLKVCEVNKQTRLFLNPELIGFAIAIPAISATNDMVKG